MALPFSSIDYSGSVQNLTFVNDTLNPIIGGAISLNAVTGVVTFRASTVPAKRLFQAYTSGTLTGPNGVLITTWNTSNSLHIDTEKTLNSSHGLVSNQYIISTAGYWRIQSHVIFSNSPGNSAHLNSYLRINNATNGGPVFNMCQLTDATHNPDQQGVTVSAILNLSVGNSVDVFVNQFTAMPLANVTNAMFECEYLGAA
tara:strand:- start:1684 stop:2283 length:600 start_codon:yes stop_codon:yes gene_type:complete